MIGTPLLHVDADAFLASVAVRGRPDLADRPLAAVAHVFIASATYPARRRGVRSGVLVADALRVCPELILVEVPRAEAEQVSDDLFDLFAAAARHVEPGSMEEAFVDVGPVGWAGAVGVGEQLRAEVAHRLGIPVSVGVGRTKLMAKLASRAAKPDGLHVIDVLEERILRRHLALSQVWGVGATTRDRLSRLGVERLSDLDGISPDAVQRASGAGMAARLHRIRAGSDDATVSPVEQRTSLTAEASVAGYARPDWSPEELVAQCVGRVCHRARRAGLVATGVRVALTPVGGPRIPTRRSSAPTATADPDLWLRLALDLLASTPHPHLVAVRIQLTGLVPAEQVQPTLF